MLHLEQQWMDSEVKFCVKCRGNICEGISRGLNLLSVSDFNFARRGGWPKNVAKIEANISLSIMSRWR